MNRREIVLGPHSRSCGQWDIWEAVFGPVGAGGYPARIWCKDPSAGCEYGAINATVAKYWREHFDMTARLKAQWGRGLGSKLSGKLHVFVGGSDTYFLTNAVMDLQVCRPPPPPVAARARAPAPGLLRPRRRPDEPRGAPCAGLGGGPQAAAALRRRDPRRHARGARLRALLQRLPARRHAGAKLGHARAVRDQVLAEDGGALGRDRAAGRAAGMAQLLTT